MANECRYVIVTLEEAKMLARATRISPLLCAPSFPTRELRKAYQRLLAEEGADMEEIVELLKKIGPCPAAVIEAQHCGAAAQANKLGRRLNRLLKRARHERAPGRHDGQRVPPIPPLDSPAALPHVPGRSMRRSAPHGT